MLEELTLEEVFYEFVLSSLGPLVDVEKNQGLVEDLRELLELLPRFGRKLLVQAVGVVKGHLDQAVIKFLGPFIRPPDKSIIFDHLIKFIDPGHVPVVVLDGNRMVEGDPVPGPLLAAGVLMRVSVMDVGDDADKPSVHPTDDEDISLAAVVECVPVQEPGIQFLQA